MVPALPQYQQGAPTWARHVTSQRRHSWTVGGLDAIGVPRRCDRMALTCESGPMRGHLRGERCRGGWMGLGEYVNPWRPNLGKSFGYGSTNCERSLFA